MGGILEVPYIIWFKDLTQKDIPIVGGKGAHLGELTKIGIPVPNGFAITTSFYKNWIVNSGTILSIDRILNSLNLNDQKSLDEASQKIKKIIMALEFDKDTEEKIINAYRKLGRGPVAVRSSATAEDLKNASFAGQQETFLNVKESELITSVKKCVASLFNGRAIYYRNKLKFNSKKLAISIIIQRMVDAKIAGIAFSVNPVGSNKDQMMIEAIEGLGEALVSGEKTPDNYILNKKTGKVEDKKVIGARQIVSAKKLRELFKKIQKIESHYKKPQDIEWTIDKQNKIYIVQARPITAMQKSKKGLEWYRIGAREFGVQFSEHCTVSVTPKYKFIIPSPFYRQVFVPSDKNAALYMEKGDWDRYSLALKKKYLQKLSNYEGLEKKFKIHSQIYLNTLKISQVNLDKKTNFELKKIYLLNRKNEKIFTAFDWVVWELNNIFANKTKEIIMARLGKESKEIYNFYDALLKPVNKSSIYQLKEISSKWKNLNEKERNSIYQKYLWIPCLDIHIKEWSRKDFFVHMENFMEGNDYSQISYENALQKLNPSKIDQKVIEIARRLTYIKDLKDDYRRMGIYSEKIMYREIARRMQITLEDSSFLREVEILAFLDEGKRTALKIIKQRRKGFVTYYDQKNQLSCREGPIIKKIIKRLNIPVYKKASEQIRGVTASQGIAKGKVVIIRTVQDLRKVKNGNIMITFMTHPDYVPAMQKAAAIVTDEGGITCHAAIVSRELKLPCIVGADSATKTFKDGDVVEVNADEGIITKVSK